jgi:hypothetical protein
MKSLGLDAIHFRIPTIVRLCFSNVFGRFFRLKIVSLLGFWRENQSGQLNFTARSCVSERAGCKKPARSDNQIASFSLIKNKTAYYVKFDQSTCRICYVHLCKNTDHKLFMQVTTRSQALSSWGAKTLVDAGHVIC